MTEKCISILIGYLCGCFLTAEAVAGGFSGKSAAELGDTGNPGMANIMASLGFLPGILTLLGDIGKCILAVVLSRVLLGDQGWIVTLYAGLGCTLGHDFPFWRRFKGGKGVATTSAATILYAFLPGVIANLIGMLTVFVTKYLCIGGPVIPVCFALFMLIGGDFEAAAIGGILSLLAFYAHGSSILGIRKGQTKQTDVLGKLTKHTKTQD